MNKIINSLEDKTMYSLKSIITNVSMDKETAYKTIVFLLKMGLLSKEK